MQNLSKVELDKSNSEFEKLLAEDLKDRKFTEGSITEGVVSKIDDKFVFVDLGLKSEGTIPIEEFKLTKEINEISVGKKITVFLEKLENFSGDLVISREKARKLNSWKKMEKAFDKKEEVSGIIISKCKGGFIVDVESCLCFLPGSQVDLKPLRDISHLMRKPQVFECVKLDRKRGNIVLSRRAILEKKRNEGRDEIFSKLKEGDIVEGVCKNLTDFGAFLDLNGIDSLLHITDISWSRVNKPSELISVGQTLKVKIIKCDQETKKISVGIKQLTIDPYLNAEKKYKVGKQYPAIVTKVQDWGCFAKLDDGLEGLIHQSELSWAKKNVATKKILSTSEKINVEILEIDVEKRRISLSYKKTQPNPWKKFKEDHPVGSIVEGKIRNITDFAIFLSVKETGLDGMVHFKDLSHEENESELNKFKKNDSVKAKVLEIDESKEKLRLGIKQLTIDPYAEFVENRKKSDIVTVVVKEVKDNGILVSTGDKGMTLLIKKNQIAADKNPQTSRFAKGDKIDAMIIELEKEKRKITLSIKALEEKLSQEAVKKYGSQDSGASLGEILGAVLKKKKK